VTFFFSLPVGLTEFHDLSPYLPLPSHVFRETPRPPFMTLFPFPVTIKTLSSPYRPSGDPANGTLRILPTAACISLRRTVLHPDGVALYFPFLSSPPRRASRRRRAPFSLFFPPLLFRFSSRERPCAFFPELLTNRKLLVPLCPRWQTVIHTFFSSSSLTASLPHVIVRLID